jgi:hypothetical protein
MRSGARVAGRSPELGFSAARGAIRARRRIVSSTLRRRPSSQAVCRHGLRRQVTSSPQRDALYGPRASSAKQDAPSPRPRSCGSHRQVERADQGNDRRSGVLGGLQIARTLRSSADEAVSALGQAAPRSAHSARVGCGDHRPPASHGPAPGRVSQPASAHRRYDHCDAGHRHSGAMPSAAAAW